MAMKPDNATRKRVVTTLLVVGGLIYAATADAALSRISAASSLADAAK